MSKRIEITPEGSVSPVFLEPSEVEEPLMIIESDTDDLRREAYRQESDSIFFKWQRGEATEQEWLDAVEDIRQRFPNE